MCHERGQDEAVASSRGRVLYTGLWTHPDPREPARKGWTLDPASGQWLSKTDAKNSDAGWVRQDLAWIPPDQAERVADGQWRVDGEWLDLEAANRRRARIDSMWSIPGGEVLLDSTADREVSLRALEAMQLALDDLRLVFGAEPALPIRAAVLRDEEQYERFAIGDPDGRRPAAHAGRLHVIHSAVLAESWFAGY